LGLEDLSELDRRLYHYIKEGDFETERWNSENAARELRVDVDDIYESLSNLSKHIRDNIYIHYLDGGIRISAD